MTRRELVRAWRKANDAAKTNVPTNAHRLLLFYAVECGLKAVYLRTIQVEVFDDKSKGDFGHNINRLLDRLHVARNLRLPTNLKIDPYKSKGIQIPRNCEPDQINQVWRYGAEFIPPNDDSAIERELENINCWLINCSNDGKL